MPSVIENETTWGSTYKWPSDGEEWSLRWGSAYNQWQFSIMPRIQNLLPVKTVLEIAPGHGRW